MRRPFPDNRFPFLAIATAAICLALGRPAAAGFVSRVYRDADGAHRYSVFVPEEYTKDRAWPVVLFLHGAGERGTDGLRPTTVGLGPVIRRNPGAFPFLAVFPQCENLHGRLLASWNADTADGKRALKILEKVEAEYRIDPKRRILTGWSMGGYGAWSLATKKPDLWSAVIPLAGGGDAALAKKLRRTSVWAFHGEQDPFVAPSETRTMAAAVRAAGGKAAFTLVKGMGHDVWKTAYSLPALQKWMRNPRERVERPESVVATDSQKSIPRNDDLVPFVPAVEISRAVTVSVSKDVLHALSYSVPQMVGSESLSGKLKDIRDTTFTEGHTFNLEFIGLSYSGTLAEAGIEPLRGNRLKLRFGLKNVAVRITKSHVIGTRRWAATGPMQITIGHRRPVWLTMELEPYVAKRSLRFRTRSKSFQIPDDNWQISAPSKVEVHGLGLTKKKVTDGLSKGIRDRKDRIEREVLAMVPNVVSEIERKLAVPDSLQPLSRLWPLPVYQPRLRIWPESVAVNERGMAVAFGVTAAAIDPSRAPSSPRQASGSPQSAAEINRGLRVGVSGEVLSALTQMLIDADVARLHVSDVPNSPFADFLNPDVITAVLPDLKRFGPKVEISTELEFRRPFRVEMRPANHSAKADANSRTAAGPVFQIPDAVISVAVRKAPAAPWTPYARFAVRLSHPLKIGVRKSGYTQRTAELQWSAAAEIDVRGRFAKGVKPANSRIDEKRVREIFTRGWNNWSASFSRSNPIVPDLVFGTLPLRLDGLQWRDEQLTADFNVPGIQLSNETKNPLTYEIRGPGSKWAGPYTLPPGRSHEFSVPHSLVFRHKEGRRTRMYTLPAGSHCAFRKPRKGPPQLLLVE